MATKKRATITNGPTHFDICIAFAYAYNKTNKHIARFRLDNRLNFDFQITSLEYESGCDGKLLFKATIQNEGPEVNGQRVDGYYNAKTQTGWVDFDKVIFPEDA